MTAPTQGYCATCEQMRPLTRDGKHLARHRDARDKFCPGSGDEPAPTPAPRPRATGGRAAEWREST